VQEMSRLLSLLMLLAAVLALSACGGGGKEETAIVNGNTITKSQFESLKSTLIEFIDAFAEEDWSRVHGLMDAESKQACPRLTFVTNMGASLGLAKSILGEQWWREVVRALREAEGVVRSITWEELRDDPEALERRLEQRLNEIFGPSEDEGSSDGLEDWRFEDGRARLHWPDACESSLGQSD